MKKDEYLEFEPGGLQQYIKKNGKAHYTTYRPGEFKKNHAENDIRVVLCSIANLDLLQFSFGSDIIEKYIRQDKEVFFDRACIWDTVMLKIFKINKSIYYNLPVKQFDLILISAYMVHQTMNVVPFLIQSSINPMKDRRKEIVILGGNVAIFYKLLRDYIDVFYFGDGEVWINKLIDLKRRAKDKLEFIEAVRNTEGLKDCVYTGIEDNIVPAIKRDLKESILNSHDFISKPVNKVVEIARGCKYDCNFCFLTHYKHPYRYNKIEDIEDAVKTFEAGTSVYPFAPDKASYRYKGELGKMIRSHGCKTYSYNKRFDSFTKETDLNLVESTSRIVFGLDGVSQRLRDFANKRITTDQIYNAIHAAIEYEKVSLIKINIIFSYWIENKYDSRNNTILYY